MIRTCQIIIFVAVLFPHIASAAKIASCRGQRGTVEFLDSKEHMVKSFTNKEQHKRKGDLVTSDVVRVYGCLRGKFAYIIRHTSTCAYGDPCNEDEMRATLEIYDHTGRRTWKEDISISSADDVSVARTDERILFSPLTPPYGIAVIDPKGVKKIIPFEGEGGGLYPNAISPSGRYGVAGTPGNFTFFDVMSGKTHAYKGPGDPWVNDAGKFEVWVGSSLKNDWSLGPDGKKVYEFRFK